MKPVFVVLAALLGSLAFVDVAHAQDNVHDGFGKCLHIPEESRSNNVQLRTWDCLDKSHIRWRKVRPLIEPKPTGADANLEFFWLRNNMTNKCAAVHKGQKWDGAPVIQWDCESGIHFQWAEKDGQLIHRESRKCLHSASGSNYAAVTISTCIEARIPDGQRWVMAEWKKGAPKVLRSGFGNCLHVPHVSYNNDTQLMTWDCRNWELKQLQWELSEQPPYQFRNKMSDKCMAVHKGENSNGARVIQWDCESAEHFQWKFLDFVQLGHSESQLQHQASGKCLQVRSAGNYSLATLATCARVGEVPANMKWRITQPQQ